MPTATPTTASAVRAPETWVARGELLTQAERNDIVLQAKSAWPARIRCSADNSS
jgi:hypothetical protein